MTVDEKLNMIFNSIAKELDITQTMLDKAVVAYNALGEHIKTSNEDWQVEVYPQGSFELGTVIKPLNADEQYDVDLVILLKQPKFSAENLRGNVKTLLETHGRYIDKIQEKKPCLRIQYADSSQFHMDIACAKTGEGPSNLEIEIACINKDSEYYYRPSNPKGYIEWFKRAMAYDQIVLERQRQFEGADTKVEEIKLTNIHSPLQKTIQILKRHRDIFFSKRSDADDGPSSIIITTLCGLAYEYVRESNLPNENLFLLIKNMLTIFPIFIKFDEVEGWTLNNPSDEDENFIKKWNDEYRLKTLFDDWLVQARTDILTNPELFIEMDQNKLREGIYKSFGETIGQGALMSYGEQMGELAKSGKLKYDDSDLSITTDKTGKNYRSHTYFG
jgi:hypothetical protein